MKKVKSIFYLFNKYIELLCAFCCYKSDHDSNHKVIDIKDKNSLEDNDIKYSKIISEFNEIFNKIKNIKQKIEEKIEELAISNKSLYNEITLYYEKEHLRLNQEEKKVKIELNEKIINIKEELKNNLQMINNIILQCEETNKAIINFNKDYDNNKIKVLYYISEINKNNKIFKDCFKVPIKDYKISFLNFSTKSIGLNENYISGIPIPKDITIIINDNKINISWNIGDVIYPEYEKRKLKYKAELTDDIATKEYQVSQSPLILDEYKENIEYKIKIRTMIDNDSYSNWSQTMKFKISNGNVLINSLFTTNKDNNIENLQKTEKSKNNDNFLFNFNGSKSIKPKLNSFETNNENNIFNTKINNKERIENIEKNKNKNENLKFNLFEKPKENENSIKASKEKLSNENNTENKDNLNSSKNKNPSLFESSYGLFKKTNIFEDISGKSLFKINNNTTSNNIDKSSLFGNGKHIYTNLFQSIETNNSNKNSLFGNIENNPPKKSSLFSNNNNLFGKKLFENKESYDDYDINDKKRF